MESDIYPELMAGNRKKNQIENIIQDTDTYQILPLPFFSKKYTSFTQPFTMKEYIKRSRMINDFLFKCKPEKKS